MKKIGLLLLAVAMVAGMAGCHQDDDSIYFLLSLDARCTKAGTVSGTVSRVSSGYQTGPIALSPGQGVTIELPEAGEYRLSFTSSTGYWDSVVAITSGYSLGLTCD